MGYFKNVLIEQQVELGDREPAPKPANDHIGLALQDDWLTRAEREHAHNEAIRLNVAVCFSLCLGLVIGFSAAVFA
jgi:hypothetical protein